MSKWPFKIILTSLLLFICIFIASECYKRLNCAILGPEEFFLTSFVSKHDRNKSNLNYVAKLVERDLLGSICQAALAMFLKLPFSKLCFVNHFRKKWLLNYRLSTNQNCTCDEIISFLTEAGRHTVDAGWLTTGCRWSEHSSV